MTLTNDRWLTQRQMADHLQISERTLLRWRASGALQAGHHYRRKFPAVNSPLLYQLERCEQAMTSAFLEKSAPDLKEQALTALHAIATGANNAREQHQDIDTIRRALEALPE